MEKASVLFCGKVLESYLCSSVSVCWFSRDRCGCCLVLSGDIVLLLGKWILAGHRPNVPSRRKSCQLTIALSTSGEFDVHRCLSALWLLRRTKSQRAQMALLPVLMESRRDAHSMLNFSLVVAPFFCLVVVFLKSVFFVETPV